MAKKILVVVDMQNDFIDGTLGNDECRKVVENVVDVIENNEYDMVYATYDTHKDNYLDTQEGKKLPVVHCIEGTDGYEMNYKVKKALTDRYGVTKFQAISKPTFGSEILAYNIRKYAKENNGDVEVDIVGVCTDICVISNAMVIKAFNPEVPINVIATACAGVTPDSHKNALEAMKVCQINVLY